MRCSVALLLVPAASSLLGAGVPGNRPSIGGEISCLRTRVCGCCFCVHVRVSRNNGGFTDERPPDPRPCQSCLNSHDRSFLGGWVADVVLGNPVGDVLMGFMDQEVIDDEV